MGNAEFSGHYSHNIDPKGRVTIPSAYREALGEGFTLGMNNDFTALALYPKEEWKVISDRLKRIPASDQRGMMYVRMVMFNSYTGQQLDGQGRLLLPAPLRERVGLDKAITFAGSGSCLEIWDTEKFNSMFLASPMSMPDLMAYVNDRYFGTIQD